MADSISTRLKHSELDRLELATIQVRWFVIALTLATLWFLGKLSPVIIMLAALSSAYNVARILSYVRHWHFLGGKRLIVGSDLLLIATLMVVLRGEPQFLYALLLLPLTSIVSWFGLRAALMVHTLNVSFIAVNSIVFGPLSPNDLGFLLFAALFSLAVVYQIAQISSADLRTRREVEELAAELSRDKARLTALIDGIGDGLLVVDPHREVVFYNLAASHLIGHAEENLRDIPLKELLPTFQGIDYYDPVATTLATGAREQRDDLRLELSGRDIRISTSVAPILGSRGEIEGAIVLFRDVTLEKEQEEEKTAFASIAAHELRTPVTVTEGYLSYLLSSEDKLHYDATTKRYLTRAHESVIHLTELISDILKVTRAETGRPDLRLETVDLTALVREAITEVSDRARAKGLTIAAELSAQSLPVEIDRGKVKEVLLNYLDNAIKFTQKGSIKVRLRSDKKELKVEVIDQGIGLSSVDLPRIWQKFYRAENWKTRRTGGTGLGLYLCKHLVEQLGGTVGVESKEGKGSTFYFTLPHRSAKARKKRAKTLAGTLVSGR